MLTIPEPFALPGDTRSIDRAAYDAEMHKKTLQRQVCQFPCLSIQSGEWTLHWFHII